MCNLIKQNRPVAENDKTANQSNCIPWRKSLPRKRLSHERYGGQLDRAEINFRDSPTPQQCLHRAKGLGEGVESHIAELKKYVAEIKEFSAVFAKEYAHLLPDEDET